MTKNQDKALAALMTSPTIKAAAAAAGVDYRTMRRYLEDPEFLAEYKMMTSEMLSDAKMRAKQLLNPALETLGDICTNKKAKETARVAAAKAILEWSTRLNELTEIMEMLEALEHDKPTGY